MLDEAGVFLSSRFWHTVPRDVLQTLAQVRKNGLDLWYTVQHEARVDTVLRELTAEMVRCKRMWGRQFAYVEEPSSKLTLRKRIIKIPAWSFGLYDTFETIDTTGGGGGVGAASSAIAARRARAPRESQSAIDAKKTPMRVVRWYGTMGHLTREAMKAYDHLKSEGALPEGSAMYEAVRSEILRQRWLVRFGLRPEQVPLDITPEQPFSKGYTPDEVKARMIDQREEDVEDAKKLSKGKKR